jgi:hypothetical protein
MNKQDIRRLEMLVRADQFGTDHPLTPVNARVTALLLLLKGVITQVNTLGGGQESGRGQFRGGASERLRLSVNLRKMMRKISDIAAVLDPATFPGAREQFRMPRTKTYQDLLNRAQAFLEAVGPIKAAFVAHDLPADFDEQLAGLITEFTTATQTKATWPCRPGAGDRGGSRSDAQRRDHRARARCHPQGALRERPGPDGRVEERLAHRAPATRAEDARRHHQW